MSAAVRRVLMGATGMDAVMLEFDRWKYREYEIDDVVWERVRDLVLFL